MSRLAQLYFTPALSTSLGGVKRLTRQHGLREKVKLSNALKWLRGQDVYTLHKPTKNKFPRRQTIVSGMEEQLQADLIDVKALKSKNDGMTYLLTAIDVFSKRAWVVPIQSKSGEDVCSALEEIINAVHFRSIQTDKGREFLNRAVQELFRKRNISHFTSQNDNIKASVVERFNKTFQMTLYRYFTHTNNTRYIEVVDNLVKAYNNSYNRSIGMTPNQVNIENQEDVWLRLYPPTMNKNPPKLQIGDYVRISKARLTFERGYTPSWSSEVYTVHNIKNTNPVVYEINDLNNDEILGTFYENELQKVDKPNTYKVEKVLKRKKVRGETKYYVKWLGYPESFNQWINQNDLV